jgi:hypothetical protein
MSNAGDFPEALPVEGDPFSPQPLLQPGERIHSIMPEQEEVLGGSAPTGVIPMLGGGGRPAAEDVAGDPFVTSLKDTRPLAEQEAGWQRFDQRMQELGVKPGRDEAGALPAGSEVAGDPFVTSLKSTAPLAEQEAGWQKFDEKARALGVKPGGPEPPLLQQDDPFGPHNPLGTHPDEEALTVNDILHPDSEAQPPRSQGVEDIAANLQDRGQNALKQIGVGEGRIAGPDPATDELLARSIASEAKQALARPGANASDWYTGKIDEAMDVASQMYPEIATDPNAKMAMRAALSITSQGETVPSNTRLATQAYETFAQTGHFPTDVVAKKGKFINGNFAKMNTLIDNMGLDGAREFLDTQMPMRDLKNMDPSIIGKISPKEGMDTPVYGSHILGPKIGGGFYQNLGGNYDPMTFDLWWMRQWNRKTGNLVGKQDFAPQQARLEAALQDPTSMNPGELQAYGGQAVPKTPQDLLNTADAVSAQHERDYTNFRPEFDSGARSKSELTLASEAYHDALNGINEAPTSGGQRAWMRNVGGRARDILAEQGHDLTNADLQAILWYPEKDLYAKLGGRPSEGLNVDYASALRKIQADKLKASQ